jgi:hypothetical protein
MDALNVTEAQECANENNSNIFHNLSNSSLWTRLDQMHVWLIFVNLNNFQDAGKKISQCYVVCKTVNVMFHQLHLHTVQNTNRYKSRHLRFKGYSSDITENSGHLGCDVVDNGGMLPGNM